MIMILIYIGGKGIVTGIKETGELTSIIVYALQIIGSLTMVTFVFVMIMIAGASTDRIVEVLNEIPEMRDPADAVTSVADGDIIFDHVSFSYAGEGGNLSLKDVNLHIKSGQTVGIIGGTGSGKSTTLACLVNQINHTMEKHIITLEDPIEYLHRHDKSIVSQREISIDTLSYVNALRASLRQSPDVILLGEMRDYETMDVAMTAAETGHLVFSTLHTIGAANTIDRIIDVFPANQQRQIAVQLSMVLQAVISQQLVPALDGTQVPAFEIMTVTPAIRNMIRDNKIPQIDGTVYSANKEDMHSMDYSLQLLVREGTVAPETALSYASNPEMLKKKL